MKHGKKILAVLSAAAIAASMSLPAFAAGVAVSNMNSVAYMDTFKAGTRKCGKNFSCPMRDRYGGQAWTVDGAVVPYLPDGTKELLPEFSDLFPGWDVTEISEYARTKWSQSDGGVVTYAVGRAGIGYEAVVNLPKATASSLGYNF